MIPRTHAYLIAAMVLAGFVAGAIAAPYLPNPSPVHWNIHGQADRYGSPWASVLATPIAAAVLALLCALLPRFGPLKENFSRFSKIYGRMIVAIVGVLLCLQIVILLKTAGKPVAIERVFPIIIGVLFMVLGNWMGKIRRNFYVGIRTPWTLANDIVWERTHRLGGHLMVALGLATVIAGFLPLPFAALIVLIGGGIAFTVWALVYSCRIYQRVDHTNEAATM